MDNINNIHFAISIVGASHLPKGIACQDYSLSWESEDRQNLIAIVCDGHGSSTYVRSDTGSRLAAEITMEVLRDFVTNIDNNIFLHKKGAVTARPSMDENVWGRTINKPITALTEIELMNQKQNQLFCDQVSNIREEDRILTDVFNAIYIKWVESINNDAEIYPFSEKEKHALGNNRIEKAYGTTLLAYVQTPYFWFSFHIGDGRILFADRRLNWLQMVPWDCNCFQNFTTSLCNSNPLPAFRYAFDGTGHFPVAVLCCSDGIEDSYGDYELAPQYLHSFYNGLIQKFAELGKDVALHQLGEFLPKLSAHGSKDDMSIAGFINIGAIEEGLKEFSICNQRDSLNSQHVERVKEQKELEKQISEIQNEIKQLLAQRDGMEEKKNWFVEQIEKLQQELKKLFDDKGSNENGIISTDEDIRIKKTACDNLIDSLNSKKESNLQSDNEARNKKNALKQQFDEIELRIDELQRMDIEKWTEFVKMTTSNQS